jgi:hypothetical protein
MPPSVNRAVIEGLGQCVTEGIHPGHPAGDPSEKFPQAIGADSDVRDDIGQVYGEGFAAAILSLLVARTAK